MQDEIGLEKQIPDPAAFRIADSDTAFHITCPAVDERFCLWFLLSFFGVKNRIQCFGWNVVVFMSFFHLGIFLRYKRRIKSVLGWRRAVSLIGYFEKAQGKHTLLE